MEPEDPRLRRVDGHARGHDALRASGGGLERRGRGPLDGGGASPSARRRARPPRPPRSEAVARDNPHGGRGLTSPWPPSPRGGSTTPFSPPPHSRKRRFGEKGGF